LLAVAALLFSTGGAAIKYTSLDAWQTAGLRSLVAATALLLLIPESRRGWSRAIVLPALAYASTLTLFVHANKLTTAANAIYLQATAPAYLLLLGPLVLKEPLRRRDILFAAVLGGGLLLFFAGQEKGTATAPHPLLGNVVAALSGVSWALTLTGIRWQAHTRPGAGALAVVTLGNLLVLALSAPMMFPLTVTPRDAGAILYLGAVQIALAYFCLTVGMRHVPAFESSVLLMIEPVMNPVWAWLLHGELPGPWASAGCLVVLVATTAMVWMERPAARN
jgi:drug/metabolite transporter (DMT)-like permease